MMVRSFTPPPPRRLDGDQRSRFDVLMGDPPPGRRALDVYKAGWRAWEGAGVRPMGLIDARLRSGRVLRCVHAIDLVWWQVGASEDIVAHRPCENGRGGF